MTDISVLPFLFASHADSTSVAQIKWVSFPLWSPPLHPRTTGDRALSAVERLEVEAQLEQARREFEDYVTANPTVAFDYVRGGARTVQTARKSTGGKAPRKCLYNFGSCGRTAADQTECDPDALSPHRLARERRRILGGMRRWFKEKGALEFVDLELPPENVCLEGSRGRQG